MLISGICEVNVMLCFKPGEYWWMFFCSVNDTSMTGWLPTRVLRRVGLSRAREGGSERTLGTRLEVGPGVNNNR